MSWLGGAAGKLITSNELMKGNRTLNRSNLISRGECKYLYEGLWSTLRNFLKLTLGSEVGAVVEGLAPDATHKSTNSTRSKFFEYCAGAEVNGFSLSLMDTLVDG